MNSVLRKTLSPIRTIVNHGRDRRYMSWYWRHRNQLVQFDNKHRDEKCFIIGNGPSLNKMDLSLLRECTCFGLNKIYLHPAFEEMNIDYHVAVNPLVIEQSIDQFARLRCPSFLSYRGCGDRLPSNSNAYYLMTEGGPDHFAHHPMDTMSEGGTVTYVALQLAYFMGFAEVYLIGVDHSFQAQGRPNEKQQLSGPDVNHFHPDYFSGQEWHLPDLDASEIAYRLARYHFRLAGRHIMDATVDGKLEVFEKVPFEIALARCTDD